MSRMLRNNSLSLVAGGLFLLALLGQTVAGRADYNEDQREHGEAQVGYAGYLRTPHFFEATFENWESEFLQMAMFIFLTAFLVQKGSAESRRSAEEKAAGKSAGRPRVKFTTREDLLKAARGRKFSMTK